MCHVVAYGKKRPYNSAECAQKIRAAVGKSEEKSCLKNRVKCHVVTAGEETPYRSAI